MVWTKWYMDKMSLDKNGTDKMVASFGIDYNSSEINTYLVTKSHKQVLNSQRKRIGVTVEAGLMKRSYCQWEQD